MAYSAGTRRKVWMKNITHAASQTTFTVKPCVFFFIQTLPKLCAGPGAGAIPISRVSFLYLFGLITEVTNPIMQSLLLRIGLHVIH